MKKTRISLVILSILTIFGMCDNILYAQSKTNIYYFNSSIKVDGIADTIWKEIEANPILYLIDGTYPDSLDCSGYFKAFWNNDTLNVLIYALDDTLYTADPTVYYNDGFEGFTNSDPIIVNEDLMRYNPGAIIFSDDIFSNSTHQFTIRCNSVEGRRNYFVLYTLSKELYQYRRTFFQHQYEQGIKGISRFSDLTLLDFTGNAIDVYSNVEGGYGIFAGYNYKMKFSPYFERRVFIYHEEGYVIGEYYNYIIYFNKDSINE